MKSCVSVGFAQESLIGGAKPIVSAELKKPPACVKQTGGQCDRQLECDQFCWELSTDGGAGGRERRSFMN